MSSSLTRPAGIPLPIEVRMTRLRSSTFLIVYGANVSG